MATHRALHRFRPIFLVPSALKGESVERRIVGGCDGDYQATPQASLTVLPITSTPSNSSAENFAESPR